MNSRTHRVRQPHTQGMTIIEVLISLVLFGVLTSLGMMLFVPSVQTDANSRQRTLALRAEETWLDRYRANLEPIIAGPRCAVAGSTLTCTYPKNDTYATPELTAIMAPFSHVVTVVSGPSGSNVRQWTVTAQSSWVTAGKTSSSQLSTRVAY